MTPKWHKLQSAVFEKLSGPYRFNVAKVDCTTDEDFCAQRGVDGYPTIMLYNKGQQVEEFSSDTDVNGMFKYAKAKARKYFSGHDEL